MADDQTLPAAEALLEGLALSALNPAFRADPHAELDRVRAQCPVRRDPSLGAWFLTSYAAVRGVVTDLTLWRDPDRAEPEAVLMHLVKDGPDIEGYDPAVRAEARNAGILLIDDPDHARIRRPIMQALYKRVAACRPAVEKIAQARLDALAGVEAFDLITAYAIPIPIDAIAYLLGVDTADLPQFRAWSEAIIKTFNPMRSEAETEAMIAGNKGFDDYLVAAMAERRRAPRDDLITDLVQLQAASGQLSDVEIRVNCMSLLVGGNLTTTDLIANGVWLFLTNPGELAKLKAQPKLINAAVEEILRVESPVDLTGRVASRDLDLGGCPVREHQALYASLKAANRDPAVWADPHRFDITREHHPHVAFGGGAHICIGAPLARLEAQVALPALFERFPNLALAEPGATPPRRAMPFFNGFERLDVVTR